MSGEVRKILVVDDEEKIVEVVSSYLESRGFSVQTAGDGQEALRIVERENLSLVILDLMLPDMPGEEVCRRIRMGSRVPVIMLTAKVGEGDLLHGLEIGADDYITKPFSLKELHGRAEAVLRRSGGDLSPLFSKASYNGGDLVIDFWGNTVKKREEPVGLTPTEQKILFALIKYPNKVFTRDELIAVVFGDDFKGYDRAVDSHVKNLRQKIEDDPKTPRYVVTVHGQGYRFGGGE